MRYLIDLSRNVIEEIRKILNEKDYGNINEFILTAIENQLALESSEIIDEDLFSSTMRIPKHPKKIEEEIKEIDYSDLLAVDNLNEIKVYDPPQKSDLEYPNIPYANDWLWGQINRIFPVKVALRVLLKMQNKNDNSVKLNDYLNYASEVANNLGTKLNYIDKEMNRKRDKKVSTALPIGGTEKTISRYKNHFLIFQRTKDRVLDGALARLKFVNLNIDGFVRLTEKGLEFAKLLNPITKDANITAIANKYLNASTGVIKGEDKLFFIVSSRFLLILLLTKLVLISNKMYICPVSSLLFGTYSSNARPRTCPVSSALIPTPGVSELVT